VGYIGQYFLYRKGKYLFMFVGTFMATLLAVTLASQLAFRLLDERGQGQLRQLCQNACKPGDQIAIFRTFKPSIMFYTRRPVDSFFHTSQLLPLLKEAGTGNLIGQRLLIIASDTTLAELKAIPNVGLKLLEQRGNWAIYQATNAKLEKVQTLEAIFLRQGAFDRAVSGTADWGPLTVPYAGGDPIWWKK
jgi:hypothetical protein